MVLIEDTVCVEMHAGASVKAACLVPGVSFNEPEDVLGKDSPKLLHIAQTVCKADFPVNASERITVSQVTEASQEKERNIGLFGYKRGKF